MQIGISIGITKPGAGSRYSLELMFSPELSVDGSSVWTIVPGVYGNPDQKVITATYTLYVNGVETAFTPVLGGDGRLTFTNATSNAEFVVVESVTAPGTVPATHDTNAVYVAGSPAYTNVPDTSWTATEALADADTRKTLATAAYAPAASRSFYVYRGSTIPSDDPTGVSVAVMTGSGSSWSWTSSGQASNGQTQYVRMMERDTATDTNRRWCSNVKTFVASNVPGVPTFSVGTGSGQGEIVVTITNGAAENGRALTRYEYSLDGGTWLTLAGGTAVGARVISGTTPVTVYGVRIRAVNVNGNGSPTASQTATSGAVAAVPAQMIADTDWTLVDKPSTGGDRLTLTVINLPSDGGSALTDIKYTINGGSPISFGLTPGSVEITSDTPELPTDVVVYAQNGVGDAPGSSLTKTPTKTTAAATTAYFGAATPSSTGGWKPTTALGDEVDLVSVVSQTGMTRTWSISSGSLVANGTPDVDNGKTLTVSTADGNIVVAIATIADAKSCGTSLELNTALGTSSSVPYQLLMRGGRSYDMLGPTDTSTCNIFKSRNYTATARRTVTTHPNDVQKWISTNWKHNFDDTYNLTISNCRCGSGARRKEKMWCYTGGVIDGLWFEDIDAFAPDIPIEVLTDPTEWPTGYSGPAPWMFYFASSNLSAIKNMQFRRVYMKNVYTAGDFCTGGAFRFENITVDTFYNDACRFNGTNDSVPKLIKNCDIFGSFAISNEIRNADGTRSQAPHSDSFQTIGGFGYIKYAVWMNIRYARGSYRGSVQQGFQSNGQIRQSVYHNTINMPRSSQWGLNPGQARKLVVSNSVFVGHGFSSGGLDSGQIRIGASATGYYAKGEMLFQNVYARTSSGNAINVYPGDETADGGYYTGVNTVRAAGTDPLTYFQGPNFYVPTISDLGTGWAAASGQTLGPYDESENWRTEIYPPLPGPTPLLYDSGADLIIAPQTSVMCAETPVSWDYQYRNANGTNNWTKVTGQTGATATLTAPNKVGIQVECRWVASNGLKGPWSDTATTISGTTAITNTAVPTLARSGATVTVTPGTYSVAPDSYTRTKTINGVESSLAGTTFDVAPGDSYYITETPVKSGYLGSPVNSATGSYPILTATAAPVIQISGTTVTLVSGPTWSDTPDSVTITKVVAGTETSWDGSSSITLTSGQSCYVKYLPVKAGYYVAQATLSNTVSASASSYPTVKNVAAQNGGSTNTTTPTTFSSYASRASGDKLLNILVVDGNPTVTPSSGWTLVRSDLGAAGSGAQTAYIYARTADGTSTDDLTVTFSASENWIVRKWCFDGTVNIATTAPHNPGGGAVTPNAPNLDLGASKPAIWIVATAYSGGSGSISSANVPASYTWIGNNISQDNSSGVGLATCSQQITIQAENPGAWGQTIPQPITYTIGVYI